MVHSISGHPPFKALEYISTSTYNIGDSLNFFYNNGSCFPFVVVDYKEEDSLFTYYLK